MEVAIAIASWYMYYGFPAHTIINKPCMCSAQTKKSMLHIIMNCAYLIEPALPLPGTGLVQALEGGVPKLVLHCLVSETVGHNVLFITR